MLSNQRFGLIMILATLLVMGATAYLLFDYQRTNREALARAQGLDLARLLGGMQWQELAPRQGSRGVLELLRRGQGNPDFAYGALADTAGRIVVEVTRPGVIVPVAKIADEPATWLGQRSVVSADGGIRFIESHAPVFDEGQHTGFIRLGYHQPRITPGYADMPFMASLLLPIFLLAPLFYFLLRREFQPLRQLSTRLDKIADDTGPQPVELQPSQALSDFMQQFSNYIETTQIRIETLNRERDQLEMSGKLLTYRSNRIDSILQNFPDAILVVDEAGEINYANGKIERLLGIGTDNIIGKKTHEWCRDPKLLPLLTFSDVKSGLQANQDTIEYRLDDGSVKNLQFSVYPLFAPADDSQILGRLVVIRDVSETHLMRQRQNEFVSHVSHELKTPLNVLAMYSESLLGDAADDPAYRTEAVNVIHDEVERLYPFSQLSKLADI